MTERLHVTYHEYGELLEELVNRLDDLYSFVYGPPRGGLPIAVHLSHRLGIPLYASMDELISVLYQGDGNHILIVDDIADTGRSLAHLIDRIGMLNIQITTACLFYKPRSVITPDIWLRWADDGQWVVFPWERSDETPNR